MKYIKLPYLIATVLLAAIVTVFMINDAMANMIDEAPMGTPDGERTTRKLKKYAPSKIPGRAIRPGGIGKEVFKPHVDELDAFFNPMASNITSAAGTDIFADLPSGLSVMQGMRFDIMRQGDPFIHPVTGEQVIGSEIPVGLATVLSVHDDSPRFGILNGNASSGDVLRISSAPIKILYYQEPGVDWDISEEYYYWLTGNKRFQVVDAPVGTISKESLIAIAQSSGTDVIVILEDTALPDMPGLSNTTAIANIPAEDINEAADAVRQRALWSKDGMEFHSSVMVVDNDLLKRLKLAGEMFWPDSGKPSLIVEVPFRAKLMHMADLNCDGTDEVILGTGNKLYFYNMDIELRAPFGLEEPLVLKSSSRYSNAWVDSMDHDGDGCDEILVTSIKEGRTPQSTLYKYSKGGFEQIWQDEVFARIIDKTVYTQHASKGGGYTGEVLPVQINGSTSSESALKLPDGIDIYEFSFVNSPDIEGDYIIAYDALSHITLYDETGEMIWRSEDSYSGALKTFSETKIEDTPEDEAIPTWAVNDKLRVRGDSVYAIYREPVLINIPGLGYKASGIIRLNDFGDNVKEDIYVREIKRAATDFTFSGNRLYVLKNSGTMSLFNIFKGRQIFTSRILVYSTEGR